MPDPSRHRRWRSFPAKRSRPCSPRSSPSWGSGGRWCSHACLSKRTALRSCTSRRVSVSFSISPGFCRGPVAILSVQIHSGLRRLRDDTAAAFRGPGVKPLRHHQVGEMHGALAFDDGALRVLLVLAGVALDHLDAFDDGPLFGAQHFNDLAALALLDAGDDHHFVALFHMTFLHKLQMTSGASEMIFMNF